MYQEKCRKPSRLKHPSVLGIFAWSDKFLRLALVQSPQVFVPRKSWLHSPHLRQYISLFRGHATATWEWTILVRYATPVRLTRHYASLEDPLQPVSRLCNSWSAFDPTFSTVGCRENAGHQDDRQQIWRLKGVTSLLLDGYIILMPKPCHLLGCSVISQSKH